MSLIMFLLFGLVVGVIARFLVPGREAGGWVISMVIGVVGSFVGGFLGRFMGFYRDGEPAGFVMSILGAILVTVAYHALTRRRALALDVALRAPWSIPRRQAPHSAGRASSAIR